MDCNTPGSPARHQLPELAQTYVYQVGDAIQPSRPLSPPSPPPSHMYLILYLLNLIAFSRVAY